MVRIRGTQVKHSTAIAAAAGHVTTMKLLRDILPNDPFKLHGYTLFMRNMDEVEIRTTIMKNIGDPIEAVVGAAVDVDHGVIEMVRSFLGTSILHSVDFDEPIEFDKDDSLNVTFGWSTNLAGNNAIFNLTLRWSSK
jgi:hypothetical protein